jgi:hypothetical protein
MQMPLIELYSGFVNNTMNESFRLVEPAMTVLKPYGSGANALPAKYSSQVSQVHGIP